MLILALGEVLEKIEEEQVLEEERPAVIITDFKHAGEAMGLAGMLYEGELNLSPKDIGFVSWRRSRSVWRGRFVFLSFWMCWEAGTGCCFLSTRNIS